VLRRGGARGEDFTATQVEVRADAPTDGDGFIGHQIPVRLARVGDREEAARLGGSAACQTVVDHCRNLDRARPVTA
jgi:hypothetical protein